MALRGVSFLTLSIVCSGVVGSSQTQDAAAMIAEVVRSGSVMVRGIEFDPRAATLSARSKPALEEVRRMLDEHTEWTFEVQVHTDEMGDANRDQDLSKARTTAVLDWLKREGIESARLVPHGSGSSKMHAGSAAETDVLAHNRVELRKLNEE
jgi:outer membrane protein OmpA-like peptidoglycan-associated protein